MTMVSTQNPQLQEDRLCQEWGELRKLAQQRTAPVTRLHSSDAVITLRRPREGELVLTVDDKLQGRKHVCYRSLRPDSQSPSFVKISQYQGSDGTRTFARYLVEDGRLRSVSHQLTEEEQQWVCMLP